MSVDHRRGIRRSRAALLWSTLIAAPLSSQADLRRQLTAARDSLWRSQLERDPTVLRYHDAAKARLLAITVANSQMTRVGRTALLDGDYQVVFESGGRVDTTRGHVTDLFVGQPDGWRHAYRHVEPTPITPELTREVAWPDTLGANFAIGDSATKSGASTDYDPLIGSWHFRFQSRSGNGFSKPRNGHWTFEKKRGDGLVEDRWRPDDPAAPMGTSLYTYRSFDPKRRLWQILGTSSYGGGEVQPGLGWAEGNNRYLIQRTRGTLTRIRYLLLDADHFIWRSDRSYDGGATWIRDFAIMEAARIGK